MTKRKKRKRKSAIIRTYYYDDKGKRAPKDLAHKVVIKKGKQVIYSKMSKVAGRIELPPIQAYANLTKKALELEAFTEQYKFSINNFTKTIDEQIPRLIIGNRLKKEGLGERVRVIIKVNDQAPVARFFMYNRGVLLRGTKKQKAYERTNIQETLTRLVAMGIVQTGYRASSLQVYRRAAIKKRLGGLLKTREGLAVAKKVNITLQWA